MNKKLKPHSYKIQQLNAIEDHQRIIHILGCYCFPWDVERSLEFALYRTFAVPSISKLLSKTGEFKNRTRKRYDDTELIMAEILENGYDSERAKQAFRRMNQMHNRYSISNDDFLYVLTTFIYQPIYWIEKYGWRKPTAIEKQAIFLFYREVGKRMGIKDIPNDYEVFEQFHHDYETKHFKYAATNKEISNYTMDLLLGMYLPKSLFFIGKPVAKALMDDKLLHAMGMQPVSKPMKIFVHGLMRLRANIVRLLPERKTPHLGTKVKRPTYPNGYEIKDLGTFKEK
ncbi:MAG: oxygenase MpaB family protein [Saprospiraceae bacterium]